MIYILLSALICGLFVQYIVINKEYSNKIPKRWNEMQVQITGAGGGVGSTLVKSMLSDIHSIVVWDHNKSKQHTILEDISYNKMIDIVIEFDSSILIYINKYFIEKSNYYKTDDIQIKNIEQILNDNCNILYGSKDNIIVFLHQVALRIKNYYQPQDLELPQEKKYIRACIGIYGDLSCLDILETLYNISCCFIPTTVFTIVINNAGIVYGTPCLYTSLYTTQKVFSVNCFAPYIITRSFYKKLLQLHTIQNDNTKNIQYIRNIQYQYVNIASVAGLSYGVGLSDYCASKSAIISYHRSLRMEISRMCIGSQRSLYIANEKYSLLGTNFNVINTNTNTKKSINTLTELTLPLKLFFNNTISISNTIEKIQSIDDTIWTIPVDRIPQALAVQSILLVPWQIDTPMFNSVTTNIIVCDPLLKILKDECIAWETNGYPRYKAIEQNLPKRFILFNSFIHLLPTYMLDSITAMLGGWFAMNSFVPYYDYYDK